MNNYCVGEADLYIVRFANTAIIHYSLFIIHFFNYALRITHYELERQVPK